MRTNNSNIRSQPNLGSSLTSSNLSSTRKLKVPVIVKKDKLKTKLKMRSLSLKTLEKSANEKQAKAIEDQKVDEREDSFFLDRIVEEATNGSMNL